MYYLLKKHFVWLDLIALLFFNLAGLITFLSHSNDLFCLLADFGGQYFCESELCKKKS